MVLKKVVSILFLFTSIYISSQENIYNSQTIPVNLTRNANAVVRLNDMNISIESQKKASVIIQRVVTVLNEEGNWSVEAGAGYDEYVKIKKIEAIIYDETGREVKKIRKKDFIDQSAVDGGTLYTDSRVLFMGYTPINYPYTVSFSCEIETSNTASIPNWRPVNDYFLSVEKDNYILNDAANIGLRFKEKNLNGYEIDKLNSETSLNYSIQNVVAIKPEDLSPALSEIMPEVMIAFEKFHYDGVDGQAKNWMEFGDWIQNSLLEGRDKVSDQTKEQVLELVKNVEDPIQKARMIYDFVQNNTRYISVQVGIGGIQPIDALEVDELKYGDCKGLSNYTQALLNIAGVESFYTIVDAGRDMVDFDTDFASLEQGNHIILGIPNKNEMLWIDCTSQVHPFGFIGDFTDNRNVLIVKKDGSEIVKTATYPDETNYQQTTAKINLHSNAGIDSEIIIKTGGIQYDNRFFLEREASKDVIEYYKEHWGYVNNLEVENYAFYNDKNKVEFEEAVNVFAMNYASINGERLFFLPNAFNKNLFIPDRYQDRKFPLEIQRGYLHQDNFSFVLPSGYQIEALPENVSIQNKFGEYVIEFLSEGDKIIYKRKLLIKTGKHPKEEYTNYRDFRKKVAMLDNSKIVLIKK